MNTKNLLQSKPTQQLTCMSECMIVGDEMFMGFATMSMQGLSSKCP